jgi:hypothetical protein
LLLKKRNKRKGDGPCIIPMNNGMWMGSVVYGPLRALVYRLTMCNGVMLKPSCLVGLYMRHYANF